jgi:hypothetical protein
MSKADERKLKAMLQSYIDDPASMNGVMLVVNEETERIDLLLLNTTSTQAFVLMLHGLQTIHENVVRTPFNKLLH